jgi:hypothetical protein
VMTTNFLALIVLWTGLERERDGWCAALVLYSMPVAFGGEDSSNKTRITFDSTRT